MPPVLHLRTCNICRHTLPISAFSSSGIKRGKQQYRAACRECHNAQLRRKFKSKADARDRVAALNADPKRQARIARYTEFYATMLESHKPPPRPPMLTVARSAIASCGDRTTPDEVMSLVAGLMGIDPKRIAGGSRDAEVTQARAIVVYILREKAKMSSPETARALGLKSHCSVLVAAKKVERALAA